MSGGEFEPVLNEEQKNTFIKNLSKAINPAAPSYHSDFLAVVTEILSLHDKPLNKSALRDVLEEAIVDYFHNTSYYSEYVSEVSFHDPKQYWGQKVKGSIPEPLIRIAPLDIEILNQGEFTGTGGSVVQVKGYQAKPVHTAALDSEEIELITGAVQNESNHIKEIAANINKLYDNEHITANSQELFSRIVGTGGDGGDNNKGHDFKSDIKLVADLLRHEFGAGPTEIVRAEYISQLTQRDFYLKLENNLLPGGSAKGRVAMGIILQNIREHLHDNPQDIAEIFASEDPLKKLLQKTYNNATIFANSSGNHGVSVAAVFDELRKKYEIENLKTVVYVPDSSPEFKQQRILQSNGEVRHYTSKDNREHLVVTAAHDITKHGGKAFIYSTSPNKEVYGGFDALANEGREIGEWVQQHDLDLARVTAISPTSDGSTFGALHKFFKGEAGPKLIAAQDERNGYYAKGLLKLEEGRVVDLTDHQREGFQKLVAKIKPGKAENGLSTPEIGILTQDQIIEGKKVLIQPENLKLVSEAEMKLASGLIYLDTKRNNDSGGAILPEKAGSVAVGSIIQVQLEDRDKIISFENGLVRVLKETNTSYDGFKDLTGLTENEISDLGLGNLENKLRLLKNIPSSRDIKKGVTAKDQNKTVAVVSGANRKQPFELLLDKVIENSDEHVLELLNKEFAQTNSRTIFELLKREKSIDFANDVKFHSGEEVVKALVQHLGIEHEKLDDIRKNPSINEGLEHIQNLQDEVRSVYLGRLI